MLFALLAVGMVSYGQDSSKYLASITAIFGSYLQVKDDAGNSHYVNVPPTATIMRVAPGKSALEATETVPLNNLAVGDRLFVKLDPAVREVETAAKIVVSTPIKAQPKKQESSEAPHLTASGASQSKKPHRETVTVIDEESSSTPYYWQMDGRTSVSCYGNTCSGYYRPPTYGAQQIQGAILKLQRSDLTIVIAQCVAKVNILASVLMAADAVAANDPNAPTVYRNCRMPDTNTTAEAVFHDKTVKLFMNTENADGTWKGSSETYSILGFLQPASQEKNDQ